MLNSHEMMIVKRCNVLIIVAVRAVVQMSMLFNSLYQLQQSRASQVTVATRQIYYATECCASPVHLPEPLFVPIGIW